jgi:hypothetical protein
MPLNDARNPAPEVDASWRPVQDPDHLPVDIRPQDPGSRPGLHTRDERTVDVCGPCRVGTLECGSKSSRELPSRGRGAKYQQAADGRSGWQETPKLGRRQGLRLVLTPSNLLFEAVHPRLDLGSRRSPTARGHRRRHRCSRAPAAKREPLSSAAMPGPRGVRAARRSALGSHHGAWAPSLGRRGWKGQRREPLSAQSGPRCSVRVRQRGLG